MFPIADQDSAPIVTNDMFYTDFRYSKPDTSHDIGYDEKNAPVKIEKDNHTEERQEEDKKKRGIMPGESLIEQIQERTVYENELFHSRSMIFLATNGLLATAVGLGKEPFLLTITGILGALVTLMWWRCSLQSLAVLKSLTSACRKLIAQTKESQEIFPLAQVEEIVQNALGSRFHYRLRPNTILARYLPGLFLLFWITFLVWQAK